MSLLFTLLLCTSHLALQQSTIFDNDSGIALANERKSMLGRLYVRYMRDMHQYTEN
ncbi:hypothetical protein GQ54DRAFT_301085 [Martensiomyces pterosporus]|nr:hypothetical protein GQ54DRAFT_301085 [Martensiomyces pterosporus]